MGCGSARTIGAGGGKTICPLEGGDGKGHLGTTKYTKGAKAEENKGKFMRVISYIS